MSFADYVLAYLPPPPARVLEVGCGEKGGVTPALAAAGYDALGIDPRAPEGPLFRRTTLEELDDPGPFAAAVAGRVLHHVEPLEPGLDKLVALAPLLVVDEFAGNHIDDAARDWYERQYRTIVATGSEPKGPPNLVEWQAAHPDLHSYETLRWELDARYDQRDFRWRPYLYRWLGGSETYELEQREIEAGTLPPLGYRYVGVARSG